MNRETWNVKKDSKSRSSRPTLHVPRSTFPFLLAILAAAPAAADFKVIQNNPLPRTKFDQELPVSASEPVMLEADEVEYDQPNDVAVALGHVTITQGKTVLMADALAYDRANNTVTATGHISVLESSGNVYFADRVELQNDMKIGVVEAFKARFSDDSVFAANRARKVDEAHTELFKAAYTPCKCFTDNGKPKDPLWQIEANRAMIDQNDQQIRYDDVSFKTYGVPILYTPYFSHPTPGADNQSGLLMPEFIHSTNLGTVYRQPLYYSIAPDKDITATPIYTSLAGPVLAAQYRQMFDSGPLMINGSITNAPNRDAQGNQIYGHEIRGNIDAVGIFKLSDHYNWGFDVRRTTDETYLRLYDFSNETLLTSKVYAEGFNFINGGDRSYASVHGLTFQGLTGQDNGSLIPVVLPLAGATWQSDPGVYNSRFSLSGNMMALFRQGSGDESRRLSSTAAWKLPYITEDGQSIEFHARLRTDIYDVNNVTLANGQEFSGITGRAIPEASLLWRYPFINRFSQASSLMLEPAVEFDVSPGGGNPEKIPNEDSLLPEFTDTNLFSSNRFAGLDRVENGPRMSYGLRGQAQFYSDKYIDWLVGQHYRLNDDSTFPFSNDLTSHFSDYVGRIGFTYSPVTLAYRFRLNRDTLAVDRQEIDVGYNLYPFNFYGAYVSLKNDPILGSKEIATGTAAINLSKEWVWSLSGTQDLFLHQTDAASTGLTYQNECIRVSSVVGKDYTNLLDIEPSLTFWLTVSFKNLD